MLLLLVCIDIPSYPVPQAQPPPAYDADPSKQNSQGIQCQPPAVSFDS